MTEAVDTRDVKTVQVSEEKYVTHVDTRENEGEGGILHSLKHRLGIGKGDERTGGPYGVVDKGGKERVQHTREAAPGHHFDAGAAAKEQLAGGGPEPPSSSDTASGKAEGHHGAGILGLLGLGKDNRTEGPHRDVDKGGEDVEHAREATPGHHFNAGATAKEQLGAGSNPGPVQEESSGKGGLLGLLGFGKRKSDEDLVKVDKEGPAPTGGPARTEAEASKVVASVEGGGASTTAPSVGRPLVPDFVPGGVKQEETDFEKSRAATKEAERQARLAEVKMEEAERKEKAAEESHQQAAKALHNKEAAEDSLRAAEDKVKEVKEKQEAFKQAQEEAKKKGDEFREIREQAQELHDAARAKAREVEAEAHQVEAKKEQVSLLEKGIGALKSTLGHLMGAASEEPRPQHWQEVEKLREQLAAASADARKVAEEAEGKVAEAEQAKAVLKEKRSGLEAVRSEIEALQLEADTVHKDELQMKGKAKELQRKLHDHERELGALVRDCQEQEEKLQAEAAVVKRCTNDAATHLDAVRAKRDEFERARVAVQLDAREAAQAAKAAAAVKGSREGMLEEARKFEAAADAAEQNARQAAREAAAARAEAEMYQARKEALWEEAKRAGSKADHITDEKVARIGDQLAAKQALQPVPTEQAIQPVQATAQKE